jgi:hypothetical protein
MQAPGEKGKFALKGHMTGILGFSSHPAAKFDGPALSASRFYRDALKARP